LNLEIKAAIALKQQ